MITKSEAYQGLSWREILSLSSFNPGFFSVPVHDVIQVNFQNKIVEKSLQYMRDKFVNHSTCQQE